MSDYPEILNFFEGLGSKVLEFEEFFEIMTENLKNEIKSLGKVLINQKTKSCLSFFSKNFNAVVNFFDENQRVFSLFDHQFCDPVVITSMKLKGISFIAYKVSENCDPIISPIPSIDYEENIKEALDSLALNI